MKWKINNYDSFSQFVFLTQANIDIIDFHWEIINSKKIPGIFNLSLARENQEIKFAVDMADSISIGQADQRKDRNSKQGLLRLKQILDIILKAEDYMLNPHQSILNLETIRLTEVKEKSDKEQMNLIFLPFLPDDTVIDNFRNLIKQFSDFYYFDERLKQDLLDNHEKKSYKMFHAWITNLQNENHSNSNDKVEYSDNQKSDKKETKHVQSVFKKLLFICYRTIWLLFAILVAIEYRLNLFGFSIEIRQSLLLVFIAAGLLLLLVSYKSNKINSPKSKPLKKRLLSTSRNKSRQISASNNNQTVLISQKFEDYSLAIISEGLPGTPEEKEGQRAFILVDEFVIGRDQNLSDLCINKNTIGRRHAKINKINGYYYLTDFGSKNGTSVDGKKLRKNETIQLPDRCRIQFADRSFYFQIN